MGVIETLGAQNRRPKAFLEVAEGGVMEKWNSTKVT
jgi:hypothetical protein